MTDFLFPPPMPPAARVDGEAARLPINRIFCVGRNYAEHAREMGVEVDREAPFYFLKGAYALVPSGATIAYPPGTANLHYEMELVVALGSGGRSITKTKAMEAVLGFAAGLDMTRRDLQLDARAKGRPWDLGKNFEQSAVLAPIRRKGLFGEIRDQRIHLSVNGAVKQNAQLSDLLWGVPELIAHLSHYYTLAAGDLIYTGTPAGVGPVVAGDVITGGVDGLPDIQLTIASPRR